MIRQDHHSFEPRMYYLFILICVTFFDSLLQFLFHLQQPISTLYAEFLQLASGKMQICVCANKHKCGSQNLDKMLSN